MAPPRDPSRALVFARFGASAARAIFERAGNKPALVLSEKELAAIIAVCGERVAEATMDAVDDAVRDAARASGVLQ